MNGGIRTASGCSKPKDRPYSEADRNFWLAYARAISQAVGFAPGNPGRALYLAAKAQTAPVPTFTNKRGAEYRNQWIYEVSNNLLRRSGLLYDPESKETYAQALKTYLEAVDFGGTAEQNERADDALNRLNEVLSAYERSRQQALKVFSKHQSLGLTGDSDFERWLIENGVAVQHQRRELDRAAAEYQAIVSPSLEPETQQLLRDWNLVFQAIVGDNPLPGVTMPAACTTAETRVELLRALRSEVQVGKPKHQRYLPQCALSVSYDKKMREWIENGRTYGMEDMYLRFDEGKIADEKMFGQDPDDRVPDDRVTDDRVNDDFGYTPWLAFVRDGDEECLQEDVGEGDVDMMVTFEDSGVFTVENGAWDLGDVRAKYPALRRDTPPSVRDFAAPQQLIVLKRLAMKLTFSERLRRRVDEMMKRFQGPDGFVRIMGVPVALRGDSSNDTTSHTGVWDPSQGVLEVIPTEDAGFATVVGTIGRKATSPEDQT
ncbi:hypothetical protein Cob_v005294 [Colletotrichum orbiculare MAFF 240422]|uniref:Uncharacterized protein n=1 Tax=Colletotrichum orbiculare (strain 104-T / ATCC 96160 / CBS 514.97 / LARS 414 / MAFF 240422) TaxID=1213857 RepID=N4VEM9_COLOR|nr:hypothetical protein Cob_v005294 [Colletotrichum orbiculare MAFF 240422]